jgi:hypothetical protein
MDEIIDEDKLNVLKEYNDYITNINNEFSQHIEKINNINTKIDHLSSLKEAIGDKIINNQMHLLWEDNNLRDRYVELSNEIENLTTKINDSSNLISNNKISIFFNQIIRILGIGKYELNDESMLILKLEKNFEISKEGYRISAGERKIIAFSYFLSEVLSSAGSNADLLKKSIIIDDPVDSSDYDKFYSFISVIENFENILKKIFNDTGIKTGQIIIFTHSALLYERMTNSRELDFLLLFLDNYKTMIMKPKPKISLITFSSYIEKITKYLIEMKCTNTKDIGNYIRRVLEIICSVENIDTNKITEINKSCKLNAIVNHLSHESLERILEPLPVSHEYIEACIELIEQIDERIPNLYRTIKEKYLGGLEIGHYKAEYSRRYLGN